MRILVSQIKRRWLILLAIAALYTTPLWLVRSPGEVFFKVEIDGAPVASANIESYHGGGPSQAPGGGLSFADLTFTKWLDKASPKIALYACGGDTNQPRVRLETLVTESNAVTFYAMDLRGCLFTDVRVDSTVSTDAPLETVSLNYEAVEWTYLKTAVSGDAIAGASARWNISMGNGGPSDPDTDGDGMPDSYEIENGLRVRDDDADSDSDSDLMSNIREYLAGTAAGDSNSVFRVDGVSSATGGVLRVTFHSVVGRIYDVIHRRALGGPPSAAEMITATDTLTTVDLSTAGPPGPGFLEVEVRAE